ncbi:hypothetical protein TRIUR3_02178 [Triticum urartu]|uniref:Uncharacterized protein n=1 Tax=Triticum urartu TaxID=4572 RepID=M7YV39_TRIUA|nr:hypothetical protein TRIUR3_02178 [Triticum urartu]
MESGQRIKDGQPLPPLQHARLCHLCRKRRREQDEKTKEKPCHLCPVHCVERGDRLGSAYAPPNYSPPRPFQSPHPFLASMLSNVKEMPPITNYDIHHYTLAPPWIAKILPSHDNQA